MRLPLRIRVPLLRLRLVVLYRWRRAELTIRVPLGPEPDRRRELPPIDTGSTYRPAYGSQFGDPSESHSSPHSEGVNCTMASAGMALDYRTAGRLRKRGGDCRHAQSDGEGGTDLYDAAEAFATFGETLTIRSGRGWSDALASLEAGYGIILQGSGGISTGCGDYTGGHAVYVSPEHNGSGWLLGDPECSGWCWVSSPQLEAFAERLSSSVMYARTSTSASSSTPPPTSSPDPCPECPPPPDPRPAIAYEAAIAVELDDDRDVAAWLEYLRMGAPAERDRWDAGCWSPTSATLATIYATSCELEPATWSRGPVPDPVASAYAALSSSSSWDGSSWRQTVWI